MFCKDTVIFKRVTSIISSSSIEGLLMPALKINFLRSKIILLCSLIKEFTSEFSIPKLAGKRSVAILLNSLSKNFVIEI